MVAVASDASSVVVGPALAASRNGSTVLIAVQTGGLFTSVCGDGSRDILVTRNQLTVLRLANGCFAQPLIAINDDGTHALMAIALLGNGGTRIYESLNNGGRRWVYARWLDGRVVSLQCVRRNVFVLLTDRLTIWVRDPTGAWTRRDAIGIGGGGTATDLVTDCANGEQWKLVMSDGRLYTSLTEGRSWNPIPVQLDNDDDGHATLYDRHAQPLGYDALGACVAPRTGAHLYTPLAWHRYRAMACGDSFAAMGNRLEPLLNEPFLPVYARTCLPADKEHATGPPMPGGCSPDGSQLGTSIVQVPRTRPVAYFGRAFGGGPTRAVALVQARNGQPIALLLERDVSRAQAMEFVIDLVLHDVVGAAEHTLASGIRIHEHVPQHPVRGYYLTSDYSSAIHVTDDGTVLVAVSNGTSVQLTRTKFFLG